MKYSQSIVLGCIGAATLVSAIPAGHVAPKAHGQNGLAAAQQAVRQAHSQPMAAIQISRSGRAPGATNLQQRSYDDDLIFLRDFFDDLNTRAFEDEDLEARSLLTAAAKVATTAGKTAAKTAPKVAAKAGHAAGKTTTKVGSAAHKLPTSNKKPLAGGKTGLTKPHAGAHTTKPGSHTAVKPGAKAGAHSGLKPGAHTATKPGAHRTAVRPGTKPGAHSGLKPGAHTAVKPGTRAGAHSALKPGAHTVAKPGAHTALKPGAKPAAGAHNTLLRKPAGAKPNALRPNTLKPNAARPGAAKPNAAKPNAVKQPNYQQEYAKSQKQHASDVQTEQRLQGQLKSEQQRIQRLENDSNMWKYRAEGARAASGGYGGYGYAPRPASYQWRRDIEAEADLFERDLDLVDEIDARDLADWVDEIDAREFDMFDEVDARDFDEEDLEMRSIEDFEIAELD